MVISLGNDTLAPVWAATLRLVLASLLLSAWSAARRQALPKGPALRAALGYGACQFGIQLPLLYWGEQHVPSGLAAVFFATMPLSSALMTRALGMERLTATKLGGAITACAGVAVLFGSQFHSQRGGADPAAALGMLAIFASATIAGVGTIILKRGPRQDPITTNAVGCGVGAIMACAESFALGETHLLPNTLASALPILYLTLAGSLGAFVLMSWLVNHWSISRTSYVSVIVPTIALTLGTLVRGEPFTLAIFAGATLVLLGLLLGMRTPKPASAA